MKETLFFKQAELLLHILPFFKNEQVFALKGGTAINFFHRNLPRLSVDIDLTYLPINNREIALKDLSQRLDQLSERIKNQLSNCDIVKRTSSEPRQTIGFLVKRGNASVKIEPNLVVRGSVYLSENLKLCRSAEENFELTLRIVNQITYSIDCHAHSDESGLSGMTFHSISNIFIENAV